MKTARAEAFVTLGWVASECEEAGRPDLATKIRAAVERLAEGRVVAPHRSGTGADAGGGAGVNHGILCPSCGCGESGVVDTRHRPGRIRRRRECIACGARFTTHEHVVGDRYALRSPATVLSDRSQTFRRELESVIDSLGEPVHG